MKTNTLTWQWTTFWSISKSSVSEHCGFYRWEQENELSWIIQMLIHVSNVQDYSGMEILFLLLFWNLQWSWEWVYVTAATHLWCVRKAELGVPQDISPLWQCYLLFQAYCGLRTDVGLVCELNGWTKLMWPSD